MQFFEKWPSYSLLMWKTREEKERTPANKPKTSKGKAKPSGSGKSGKSSKKATGKGRGKPVPKKQAKKKEPVKRKLESESSSSDGPSTRTVSGGEFVEIAGLRVPVASNVPENKFQVIELLPMTLRSGITYTRPPIIQRIKTPPRWLPEISDPSSLSEESGSDKAEQSKENPKEAKENPKEAKENPKEAKENPKEAKENPDPNVETSSGESE